MTDAAAEASEQPEPSRKAEKLAKVHARALRQFDAIQCAVRDERMQCLKDRRFASIAGAQWEGPLGEQFENKPKFEMNKVHLAVIRIINEYRNNRITVDFTSKDGSENDKMADTCDGLYRADEQDSGAQEAYDNAFEEAVTGGFGAFRMRAAYEDEDDDEDTRQRIRIEPIFDADSCVFFDLGAKRQDKADAKHCFVLTAYPPDAYEEEFEDDPTTWPKGIAQHEFDWSTPSVVYVAEYYEIEQKSELVHWFRGLQLGDDEAQEMEVSAAELEADPGMRAQLEATGFREVRQKRVKRDRVHKYLLNGNAVIEDCGLIAGKCIPIVPVFGKRWYVDGIERCMGHVRLATDAQRLKNMLISALAEIASMSSIEKPIFTPEQMAGHTQMWSEDNVKRYPYLLVNPMTDANGQPMPAAALGYTKAPVVPQALAALLQITEQDLQDLLGNAQAGEEIQPNISGKAVELIQNRLDMQVFIYMSNFAKGIKRAGEVWLSMAKELLVEPGRKMKTVSPDNATGTVELLRPEVDEDGASYLANDLNGAKFDVNVDVGPSSSSKKAATVRAVTGLLQMAQDPETRTVLEAAAMMNMEGEGMADYHDYFRNKLVRMGVVKPTEEERKQMEAEAQNAKPGAQDQFLAASAEKAMADKALATAKIGLTHAQTMKTLDEVESSRMADTLQLADALTPGPVTDGAVPQEKAAPHDAAQQEQPQQGVAE